MVFLIVISVVSLFATRGDWLKGLPLILVAFLPPIILYAASKLWQPVMLDRAMLPAGAALTGIWGMALSRLPHPALKPLAAVGLPLLVLGLATYYADPNATRPRIDAAVLMIKNHWQPGDVVYHAQLFTLIRYEYYLKDYPEFTMPMPGSLTQGNLTEPTKAAMHISDIEKTLAQVRDLGYERVWFVSEQSVVTSDYALQFQDHTLKQFPVLAEYPIISNRFDNIRLYLLELKHNVTLVFQND
jgi:hypothetical protein